MFTGLVTDIGEITAVREVAPGLRRLRIACASAGGMPVTQNRK